MATLPPGTEVQIRRDALERLSLPPPEGATLLVAVHEGALNAPGSPHTQVIGLRSGDLVWAGAMGEHLLRVVSGGGGDPRQLLGDAVGTGSRLWDVVWPEELLTDPQRGPLSTVYRGDRPWVVIGTVTGGDLLAAPLNDATNPKRFTPVLGRDEVRMPGSSKDSQMELAHVWTLPASLGAVGTVLPSARDRILRALRDYF